MKKQYKYVELSGTLHTRERCESLRNQTQGTQKKIVDKPLSIEERLVRLERIVLDPQK